MLHCLKLLLIAVIAGQQGIEALLHLGAHQQQVVAVVDAKVNAGASGGGTQTIPAGQRQPAARYWPCEPSRLKDTCQWRDVHGVHCVAGACHHNRARRGFTTSSRLVPLAITGTLSPLDAGKSPIPKSKKDQCKQPRYSPNNEDKISVSRNRRLLV